MGASAAPRRRPAARARRATKPPRTPAAAAGGRARACAGAKGALTEDADGAEARAQARTRGEHQAVGTRPCEGGGRDPRTCPIAGRSAPLRRRAAASRDWPPRPPPPPPPPLRCAAPPQRSPRAGRALRVAHARRACVGRVRVSMAKRGGIGRRWRGARLQHRRLARTPNGSVPPLACAEPRCPGLGASAREAQGG